MDENRDSLLGPQPSIIGQLVDLALRRDPLSGHYSRCETSLATSAAESDHRRLFTCWMGLTQEERLSDLRNFQSRLTHESQNFAAFWITSDIYRTFAPCMLRSGEKAVYALEMRMALALVDRNLMDEGRRLSSADRRVTALLNAAAKGDLHMHLTDIATRLGLSAQHLGRLFAKEIGVPLRSYLAIERSRKAVALLDGGALRIQSIAQALGYSNASNFINDFRSVLGCTPREYREQKEKHRIF
jgi:AraC-like DNA-binding protein